MEWLQLLQKWIKQLFKPKSKYRRHSSPKIIQRWDRKYCSVLRIERDTPGEKGTYRITSIHGYSDYLITLDYLPELQYARIVSRFGESFEDSGLAKYTPSIGATHRFALFHVWHNGSNSSIGIWDVNLESHSASFALCESAPKRAVALVAMRCLQITNSSKTPSLS